MDFGEAFVALKRSNQSVRRVAWRESSGTERYRRDWFLARSADGFDLRTPGGGLVFVNWRPMPEDLHATDWEVA